MLWSIRIKIKAKHYSLDVISLFVLFELPPSTMDAVLATIVDGGKQFVK
jgi:hypothetical protein